MAVTNDQMAQILNRAKTLCNPKADRMLDSMKSNKPSAAYDPDPNDFDGDDSMYLAENYNSNVKSIENYQANPKCNVPSFIQESMLNKRIDANALGNVSVVDGIINKMPKQPERRQQIAEEMVPQNYQPNGGSAIDYSLIRAIINECIETKMKEYFGKQSLNESSGLKTIGLSNGQIKLVDNSGNVYSAKLEYKGKMKKSDK